MRVLRISACLLLGLLAILLVSLFLFQTPATDPAEMRAKYSTPFSSFASLDSGLNIHYSDRGCRECPTLVLLHGNNASLHTFERLGSLLESQYRVVTYDQAGHGLTGPHPQDDYSAEAYQEGLSELLKYLHIDRFALCGSSMGGWIAWRYALANPDKLTALILISASGAPQAADAEEPRLYLGARIMRNPIGRWISERITPKVLVERSLLEALSDDSLVTESLVNRYWELLRIPGNRHALALRASTDREAHYAENVDEITTPTLVLWGAEDSVRPVADAHTFASKIVDSQLVVLPNTGHAPMEEDPQGTAQAIMALLDN